MSDLASTLREARAAKGWSLRKAEEITGVSNGYLSLLETGKAISPSPTVLSALAEKYELPFDKLMELAGHPSGAVHMGASGPYQAALHRALDVSRDAERWNAFGAISGSVPGILPALMLRSGIGVGSDANANALRYTLFAAPREVQGEVTTVYEPKASERADVINLLLDDVKDLSIDQLGHVRAYVAGMKTPRRAR